MLRSFCRVVPCVACCLILAVSSSSQDLTSHALPPESSASSDPVSSVSVPPGFQLPVLTGTYAPDGTFRKASKLGKNSRGRGQSFNSFRSPYADGVRPAPDFMDLHSIEYVVENFEPPAHAVEQVKGHSVLGNLRDSLVTFAYGREWVLMSPTDVTTDSRQRLIIADPEGASVHVLEPKGKNSFRIAGGPQLRLHSPSAVAVDQNDNIYVGDRERGVVLVFNPDGRYVRTIGLFSGESMFQSPAAIAVDRQRGHLYVIDAPMRELFLFDLSGRLISRIGGPRDKTGKVRFENPIDIAVGTDRIFVLDAGSRIQILGLNGEPLSTFQIPNTGPSHRVAKNGLALDSAGNFYLSNALDSDVEILTADGHPLGVLGHPGSDDEGFKGPSGIWIDGEDRMFVADTSNRRIQVFQLNNPQLATGKMSAGD